MVEQVRKFTETILLLGKRNSVEAQVFVTREREFQVRFQNGEQDQYTDAGKFRIIVQVLKDGKLGTSYTETTDEPERIFRDALENASIIDTDDVEYFHDGSGTYPSVPRYDESFESLTVRERLRFTEEVHRIMRSDERIVNDWAVYGDVRREYWIANTLGLYASFALGGGYLYASAIAKDSSPRAGFEYVVGKRPSEIDPVFVGNGAKEMAIKLIGSKSVPSGKYRVLLLNDAFSDLLVVMLNPMINADNAHKNLSPLKGRLGQTIASEVLTVKDLPSHPLSFTNMPFDSQGVPTKEKAIIEAGVFKTFLHNLKTAKREGVEPTGNAHPQGIGPINLYVEPGQKNFDELVRSLGDGIIVLSLDGLHAGANAISGNFSLSAKGLRVENGTITHGVEQITISGNFLDLLRNIEDVGSDVRAFVGPSTVVTPSVVVRTLDIAGALGA